MKRRQFLTYLGCGCCALALNACTTTPITGRKQLKIYPESMINAQAAKAYNQFKRKAKLSKDLSTLNSIKTIGKTNCISSCDTSSTTSSNKQIIFINKSHTN